MPDDLALAAEALVRALAASRKHDPTDGVDYCWMCGEVLEDLTDDGDHGWGCLWLQAVRWVAARDATPPAAARPSLARALNMARPHPEAVPE